jgi:hypothetical protein
LLVAVIAVALAVGGVSLLSKDAGTANDASGSHATAPSDDASTPDDDKSAAADDEKDDADPSPKATEPDVDIAGLVAKASTTAKIRVLNDCGEQCAGQAGKGKDALAAKGFKNLEAANYPAAGSGVDTTTVWYVEGRSDTAAAVAAILGIPSSDVKQVPSLKDGDVIVVVKSALTPAA